MNVAKEQPAYPRGSEWRKWDLQVHTPFSELNNGFGHDFDQYAKRLLEAAVTNQIAVVGITDYFCIEGYKRLRQLLSDEKRLQDLVGVDVAAQAEKILFLPNVELRVATIVRDAAGNESRVNFHVLFSDEVPAEQIEENFLQELRFAADASPGLVDESMSLTLSNLERVGQRLKSEHQPFADKTDLFVGMMTAVVDHSLVGEVLENNRSIFQDRYLLCLPADEDLSQIGWNGQGHLERKLLLQKSHILFSANANTRQFALGHRHDTVDQFLKEFKTKKPCVNSSDAHSFSELFHASFDRHTWLKADPTFRGLRQVVNEPEDRVFIGELPPSIQRVRDRPTRVIESVQITRRTNAKTTDRWFNTNLPLNPSLVAIVGNKGSGKSALSDVIGLVGGTPRYQSFSFLTQDRFRHPKIGPAKEFTATLTWADGEPDCMPNLGDDPDDGAVEKVKYIPQNYLEEICNEIDVGKGSRFYRELEEVIFSYVPDADRRGFSTLDQLLRYRSEEADSAIQYLIAEIEALNRELIEIEEQLSPQHLTGLNARLAEKRRELAAHDAGRPVEVLRPGADAQERASTAATSAVIAQTEESRANLLAEILTLRETDATLARRILVAEKLVARLENVDTLIKKAVDELTPDLLELAIEPTLVVSIAINKGPVEQLLAQLLLERQGVLEQLNAGDDSGLEWKRRQLSEELESLEAQLSAPERHYQAYLHDLAEWEAARLQMVGSKVAAGSIGFLEEQIKTLLTLPQALAALRRRRERKMVEIMRQKLRLRGYYATYYGAVQQFLDSQTIANREGFGFKFEVSVAEQDFASKFLSLIHQGRVGPFSGLDEGTVALKKLVDSTNFDSPLACLGFTRRLLKTMTEHQGKAIAIHDQLKQSATVQGVYDLIYSLEYLSPAYHLQWDGKRLEQLSPGERGNLLLIFYLLVDKDDTPLVIDQPEENLDNQTVFLTLVPCVREAKKRRQIVMVTHNPNLAINCDAEQVIYAEMHKDHGNEVIYESGSLEDPVMNKHVVNVLEGTRPAFDRRGTVYLPA